MTKTFFRPALIAALIVAAPAGAFAQAYEATGSQAINTERLTPAQAQAQIEIAARKVCKPADLSMAEVRAARDCYRRAKAGAQAQLASLEAQKNANDQALAAATPRTLPVGN